jgi:hypothetical protein
MRYCESAKVGRFVPFITHSHSLVPVVPSQLVSHICSLRTGLLCVGKNATFEVQVLDVKTRSLPAWDDNLANTVREGMTLQILDAEVGIYAFLSLDEVRFYDCSTVVLCPVVIAHTDHGSGALLVVD